MSICILFLDPRGISTMNPPHCTRKNSIIITSIILLVGFVYLHCQQNIFQQLSPQKVYNTLKHGYNKSKNFISDKMVVKSDDGVKCITTTLEKKLNDFLKKMERMISLNETKDERQITLRDLDNLHLDLDDIKSLPNPESWTMNEKWIVVTGTSSTSNNVKVLANMPTWNLLIVQDKKSSESLK